MTEFRVGDRVSWAGVEGVVENILDAAYSIAVIFPSSNEWGYFTLQGLSRSWHTEPSLKLIERAKRKVKKELRGWVNIYSGGKGNIFFHSREDAAKRFTDSEDFDSVEVKGEYLIEEDET